jgi:ParB-like partition proteins
MAKPKGLGKGLDALFMDSQTPDSGVSVIKLSSIEPNRTQPRTKFDSATLQELADSIREHGVLQPLLVRPMENGMYQIVAGERRWRASRMAGLSEVPAVVREMQDSEALELALIENLQREDLNPVELALGYQTLMREYGLTQEAVARRMGKSRPAITNALRILGLPLQVQEFVRQGKVSMGQAKALLALEDAALQLELATKAAGGTTVTVREIERLAQQKKAQASPEKARSGAEQQQSAWGENFYKEMELALTAELGRKVQVQPQGKKGRLVIEFYNKEDLTDLAQRLAKSK